MTDIDPVTLSVIRGRMKEAVNEMDSTLINSAFSPVICEANDIADGLYRANGNTITQGSGGLPIFVGNMEYTVKTVVEKFAGDVAPGDVFVTNDPYAGGTHLMDIKIIRPYFADGELVAFVANTGHWSDIGAAAPGGFSGKATSIYQEGIRVPPMKLFDGGDPNEEVLETLFANVRNPRYIRGDYKAQLNAIEIGRQRLEELVDAYGTSTLLSAIEELERKSEGQMRAEISAIEDGEYRFTDYIDNDGYVDEPIPIDLRMEVSGDEVLLDFTETTRPPSQGAFNMPLSSTKSSCNIAFKHVFPDIPINAGCFAPIDYEVPEDSILNAKRPRAVGGITSLSCRVVDVTMGALSKAIPEEVPANAFSESGAVTIGGERDGREFVMNLFLGGGYGGSKNQDGLNHCTPPYARARVPSMEVQENRYPIAYNEKSLRADSGGPGRRRGGLGTGYELEVREGQVSATYVCDRVDFPPLGANGGKNAACMEFSFEIDGEEYVPPFRSKGENIELTEGDRIVMKSPGGGGYGSPLEREPERVLEDVRFGYVTPEHAREEYGVVVETDDGSYAVDREATRERRSEMGERCDGG